MKRYSAVLFLGALAACGGSSTTPASDAGIDAGVEPPDEVAVSGVVTMLPEALAMLADAGVSSSVAGLTLRVEEPFKVAVDDPAGIFHTQTLGADGAFSATQVPTDLVTLGIAAGVRDDSGEARVIRAATTLYDVALMDGAKPMADVTGRGYAVPVLFHDALTAAVGPTTIAGLTGTTGADSLIEAGFILGRVVDAAGQPVSGVTVSPVGSAAATKAARLFYPTADLASTQPATSASGLFVYVHNGGAVDTFQFRIAGHDEYKQRNAGAMQGACLVLPVFPGTVAP